MLELRKNWRTEKLLSGKVRIPAVVEISLSWKRRWYLQCLMKWKLEACVSKNEDFCPPCTRTFLGALRREEVWKDRTTQKRWTLVSGTHTTVSPSNTSAHVSRLSITEQTQGKIEPYMYVQTGHRQNSPSSFGDEAVDWLVTLQGTDLVKMCSASLMEAQQVKGKINDKYRESRKFGRKKKPARMEVNRSLPRQCLQISKWQKNHYEKANYSSFPANNSSAL